MSAIQSLIENIDSTRENAAQTAEALKNESYDVYGTNIARSRDLNIRSKIAQGNAQGLEFAIKELQHVQIACENETVRRLINLKADIERSWRDATRMQCNESADALEFCISKIDAEIDEALKGDEEQAPDEADVGYVPEMRRFKRKTKDVHMIPKGR